MRTKRKSIKRLPELGGIIHRDPGRLPVRKLLIIALFSIPASFLTYWLIVSSNRRDTAEVVHNQAITSIIITLILIALIAVAVTHRTLAVCEFGLVRYISILGPFWGNFLIIDYPSLLPQSVLTTDNLRRLRREHRELEQFDGSTFNEGDAGSGLAFLARSRDTDRAIRGEQLGARERMRVAHRKYIEHCLATRQPIDPTAGIVCWTHASRADPSETATAILQAMARTGDPHAAIRLNQPSSALDPIWEQFRR